jgi:hypothetical protein
MPAKWSKRWDKPVGTVVVPEKFQEPERKFRAESHGKVYYFTARDHAEAMAKALIHFGAHDWGTPRIEEYDA